MDANQYADISGETLRGRRHAYHGPLLKACFLRSLERKLRSLHAQGTTHFGDVKFVASLPEYTGGEEFGIRVTENDGAVTNSMGRFNHCQYAMLPTPAIFAGGLWALPQRMALGKIWQEAMAERLADAALRELAKIEGGMIHREALSPLPLVEASAAKPRP